MLHNIFYKICRECMAQVPFSAVACSCGHSFELDKPDLSFTAEVVRTESEERLYEAYLEARLQQMMYSLRALREEYGPGRWTPEQLGKVRRTLRAVEAAKNDLTAQRQKTLQASAAVSARKKIRKLPPRLPTAVPAPPAAPSSRVTEPPLIAGQATVPDEAFRARQSARAQRLHPDPEKARHCPHCTAVLPLDSTRCACGHDIAVVSDIPEFVLPDEEYALLPVFGRRPT